MSATSLIDRIRPHVRRDPADRRPFTDRGSRSDSHGNVLRPLANDGFSTKFGWINDRFEVSCQLNLK